MSASAAKFDCQTISLQKRPEGAMVYLCWYEELDSSDAAHAVAPATDMSTLLPTYRLCPPDNTPGTTVPTMSLPSPTVTTL